MGHDLRFCVLFFVVYLVATFLSGFAEGFGRRLYHYLFKEKYGSPE